MGSWIVSQNTSSFDASSLNLINPPRRDVASLPGNGHLAIAFPLDNPGSWLMHCHIAWHASEGFALQFVETQGSMVLGDVAVLEDTCSNWKAYASTEVYLQDDSGI